MTWYSARPAAESDALALLAWRNDPDTLRWVPNHDPITWPDHVRWLRSTIAADDRLYRVVQADGRPVASVRYDRDPAEPSTVEVSILVASEARGHGVGAETLRVGEDELVTCWPEVQTIVAVVHCDNAGSRRLFARAGYHLRAEADPWLTLTKTVGDAPTLPTPCSAKERAQR